MVTFIVTFIHVVEQIVTSSCLHNVDHRNTILYDMYSSITSWDIFT